MTIDKQKNLGHTILQVRTANFYVVHLLTLRLCERASERSIAYTVSLSVLLCLSSQAAMALKSSRMPGGTSSTPLRVSSFISETLKQ